MKKVLAVLTFFAVVALAGTSSAWQGRMSGMGNPQGLIGDESDFLIHPANIVSGEGVKYYLDYQFTYTDLIHMDSNIDAGIPGIGTLPILGSNATSAQQYDHNSLIGAAFPLAKGRMGVFFAYDNKSGDFDSDVSVLGNNFGIKSDADSRLDNFALRFIYGQPVKTLNLGVELEVAYRDEDQKEWLRYSEFDGDDVMGIKIRGVGTTLPFMVPYDSQYWEMSGKVGLNKKFKSTDIDWTVYGGGILSADSDNKYKIQGDISEVDVDDEPGNIENASEVCNTMNGDVRGYRIGSDLWIRHHVNDSLTLPFLVSVGYTKKDRDGNGPISLYEVDDGEYDPFNPHVNLKYKDIAKTWDVKVGGGVEKEVKGCGRVGAGLYYNYLQSRDRLDFLGEYVGQNTEDFGGNYLNLNLNKFPYHKEHRLVLKLAGEQVVCDDFTVRGGLDFFYGWVRSDDYSGSVDGYIDDNSGYGKASLPLDGKNWGIEGSFGATQKFAGLTFEPFIKGGYRLFDVDGSTDFGRLSVGLDKKRAEWFTGAGLSVLFGK